jgi:dolichol-phosphate mannosyltransferase
MSTPASELADHVTSSPGPARPHEHTDLVQSNDHALKGTHYPTEASSAAELAEPHVTAAKIFVVLPAYNEADGLPSLLTKIQSVFAANRRDYHVIVVDDASTDNTAAIASQFSFQMPLTLVQHKVNQNLPGALRSGFTEATNQAADGDIIVTMDGDDTHPPGIINPLIQKISEGYDVVTASRYQPGSRVMGVPQFRVLMTYGAKLLFQTIMPIPGVRDYTCGYRAYRKNVLKDSMDFYGDSFVSEKGFSCMADVLLKMRRFKYAFGEVPFLLRYDQKLGDSKMAVGRTVWLTLKLLLKRRLGGY